MVESLPNTVFSETFRVGGTQASGKRASIVVHLTPSAPAPQRASAYGFNASSLDRFGACNDANDMLPMVH